MQLLEMHGRLAYSALFYCVILTIWGLFRVIRRMNLDSSYWSAVLVGETFILVQIVLGVILAINGLKDLLDPGSHILFGLLTVLTLPVVYYVTRNKPVRRSMLYYALGFLFLVGTILSGISSAG